MTFRPLDALRVQVRTAHGHDPGPTSATISAGATILAETNVLFCRDARVSLRVGHALR
jgi:hypothetical protein